MDKQCDNFKGCTPSQCGASLIDTLLVTRLGFTKQQAEVIKDKAKRSGLEPVEYIRNKVVT